MSECYNISLHITLPSVITLITSMSFKHKVSAEKESASLVSQKAVQVGVTTTLLCYNMQPAFSYFMLVVEQWKRSKCTYNPTSNTLYHKRTRYNCFNNTGTTIVQFWIFHAINTFTFLHYNTKFIIPIPHMMWANEFSESFTTLQHCDACLYVPNKQI
jgi:hypothetical protein